MSSKREVLVVESDETLGGKICSFLQEQGYATHLAASGEAALRAAQGQPFDVVIVDEALADASGLDVLEPIAQRFGFVRSILLSERTASDGQAAALPPDGALATRLEVLPKPLEWEALHRCVDQAVVRLQAERLQEDLMSTIAHDLKIPLTSILGCCSLLLGKELTEEARRREMVVCVQRNGQRILSMLENYLTVVRAQAGQLALSLSPVELSPMVNELLHDMQFEAERRRSHIEAAIDPATPAMIIADAALLHRVLANLLSNAIKYSPWEATVRIALAPARLEKEEGAEPREAVEFAIINPGHGIAPEEIGQVFDRYHRLSSSQGTEGCGLGLTVVKTVVEAHDGVVAAESRMNETTIFRVKLPVDGPRE